MIYDICHVSSYVYETDVSLSHHILRVTPRELARQRCLTHQCLIDPTPTALQPFTDYFGNALSALTIEAGHGTFRVESRSRVEVRAPSWPVPRETLPWDDYAVPAGEEPELDEVPVEEFLFDSPGVRRSAELAAYAAPSFASGRPVLDAVLDLTGRIFKDFKFDPTATTVSTPLTDVLRLRRGVCQDFAQLQIGCLRSLGLPARYVSGYLETVPPPGKPKLVGADASHAWVAFYCPDFGWIDVDPTNNVLPSERHITVALGRDYGDVSPIRGVILGAGEHELKVAVDVAPVGETESAC